jgi:predicted O-methyltransferase YrrM
MRKLNFAYNYLVYLIQSKTKYDIHSPFVFNLLTQVIQTKETSQELRFIESLKESHNWFSKRKILNNYSSKSRKYKYLLFRLVKHFESKNILELETSAGINTSYLAMANPKSTIYSIEKSTINSEKAKNNFMSLGLNNINLIIGDFDNKAESIFQEIKQIDLLHLNSNPKEKQTLNYFEKCLPHIHNDSIFVIDGIYSTKEMKKVWAEIKKNSKVKVSIDLYFIGVLFFKKELTKENFMIRF